MLFTNDLSSYSLEEEMGSHSSFLAKKIPWTEEPGRLQSIVLQRVGHYQVYTHSELLLFAISQSPQVWGGERKEE